MRLNRRRRPRRTASAAAAGLLLILSSCGSSSGREERSDRSALADRESRSGGGTLATLAEVATPQTASPRVPGPSTWRGTYDCAQGQTGLEVTLRPVSRGKLEGTFSFYPVASNPSVPRGCFRITAQRDESGRFETAAGPWVRQPADYGTVNLAGRIDASGQWTGRVLGAGGVCTSFNLDLATAPRETCG